MSVAKNSVYPSFAEGTANTATPAPEDELHNCPPVDDLGHDPSSIFIQTDQVGMPAKNESSKEELELEQLLPGEATAVIGAAGPKQHGGGHAAYRPDIDGLRALAVTAVVLFHLDEKWLPGGFTGVDMFFVVSGYVVSGSLLRRTIADSTGVYFADFYCRRVKRLTPSLLCCIFISSVFAAIFIPPWFISNGHMFLLAQLALVAASNVYLALGDCDGGGYFAVKAVGPKSNPFTHTWSLAVEEQFYLLFPLLLLAGHGAALSATCTWNQSPIRSMNLLVGFTLLTVILSAMLSDGSLNLLSCSFEHWTGSANASANAKKEAFYMIHSRFWEMALGAVLMHVEYCFPDQWKCTVSCRPLVHVLEIVFLGLFVYALGWSENDPFPIPFAVPSTVGTMCFIIAGSSPYGLLKKMFGHAIPVYIGKLSYPIYLFHWPIIIIWKWVEGPLDWWEQVFAMVICVAMAVAAFEIVETRIVQSWKPPRWFLALVFLLLIGMLQCWLFLLQGPLEGKLYYKEIKKSAYPTITGPHNCECSQNRNTVYQPPNSKNSSIIFGTCFMENSAPYEHSGNREGCQFNDPPTSANLDVCLRGRSSSHPVLYLVGDSHAAHFGAGIRAAVNGVYSISEITFDAAQIPAVKELVFDARLQGQLLPGDVVVFGFYYAATHNRLIGTHYTALNEMVTSVLHSNATAILFGYGPDFSETGRTGLECTIPGYTKSCIMRNAKSDTWAQEWASAVSQIAAASTSVLIWDFYSLMCFSAEQCDVWVPGTNTLAYYDNNHLTVEGSLYLWPYICSFFSSNGLL